MTQLKSRKDLVEAFKKAGLPSSTPWLNKMEKLGVILPANYIYAPKRALGGKPWRFYTDQLIEEIKQRVIEYRKNIKK